MQNYLKTVLIGIFLGLNFISASASANDMKDEDLNDTRSILDKEEYDSTNPTYIHATSHVAIGLRFALHGVPGDSAIGDLYQFYAEWVLPFQRMGIFSVGGNLGVFALHEPDTALPYPNYLNALLGGQARYQLKFTPNQLIVPTAEIELDYYRFLKPDGQSYLSGINVSPSFGVFINMGWIDSVTAKDAYENIGLSKAYLTLEVKPMKLSTDYFSLSGAAYLFGIRTEFE